MPEPAQEAEGRGKAPPDLPLGTPTYFWFGGILEGRRKDGSIDQDLRRITAAMFSTVAPESRSSATPDAPVSIEARRGSCSTRPTRRCSNPATS